MIKIVLQFAIPIMLFLGLAYFASDGLREKEDFWYVILLPFAIITLVAFFLGIILFFSWLY